MFIQSKIYFWISEKIYLLFLCVFAVLFTTFLLILKQSIYKIYHFFTNIQNVLKKKHRIMMLYYTIVPFLQNTKCYDLLFIFIKITIKQYNYSIFYSF